MVVTEEQVATHPSLQSNTSCQFGLSDLTRSGPLLPELDGLLAWIACIADARPLHEYMDPLADEGFTVEQVEEQNGALRELVRQVQAKLMGAELMVKLGQLDLPHVDFDQARQLARHTAATVRAGKLGYALFVGTKSIG